MWYAIHLTVTETEIIENLGNLQNEDCSLIKDKLSVIIEFKKHSRKNFPFRQSIPCGHSPSWHVCTTLQSTVRCTV